MNKEQIYTDFLPLFKKIAKKYMNNNSAYDFDDIINECYIKAVVLVDNYEDKGEKSSVFGYVERYLGSQIHRMLTRKQIMKVDTNKKDKDSGYIAEQYTKCFFDEEFHKTSFNDDVESVEYSVDEFHKLYDRNKPRLTKNDKRYIDTFLNSEGAKIGKTINDVLDKFIA